ncbi:DUF523 domain-containing protein [Thermosulfurimonas dismutans]|uniref:Uncharacterized protein n=1 Tax=Thermosulfurimonas dismutans TaxID=999894 RepID=A0A179D6U2_9BACT|nr:DUF523 domain-containing protein [Thermosulfurimonas dismutans]OAQ21810.1 hypothetical protein TDIS_0328 [Thermosulfurimonas dismutans]
MREPVLISACLLGLATRYDGEILSEPVVTILKERYLLIPACPEQLGGLSTPRPAAEILEGDGLAVLSGKARVVNRQGEEVTEAFVRGAREVLKICQTLGIRRAFLKARSPSCGLSPKLGVTAALLLSKGLEVYELG